MTLPLCNPVVGGAVRCRDGWGEGHFGAPRGARRHNGLDILAGPGAPVCSPIDALVVREACPYDDDAVLSGVLLRGEGTHTGLELKLFYVQFDPALVGTHVRAGDPLGQVQDLQHRYPGIANHVHLEVRIKGACVDPVPLIGDLD